MWRNIFKVICKAQIMIPWIVLEKKKSMEWMFYLMGLVHSYIFILLRQRHRAFVDEQLTDLFWKKLFFSKEWPYF